MTSGTFLPRQTPFMAIKEMILKLDATIFASSLLLCAVFQIIQAKRGERMSLSFMAYLAIRKPSSISRPRKSIRLSLNGVVVG